MKIMLVIFIMFISSFIFSQDLKTTYINHDQIINLKNTSLSYGALFIEEYKKINDNHNYFSSEKFLNGEIDYNGQRYYNIDLRYDLVKDDLMIIIPDNKKKLIIILEKKYIDSFKIGTHFFTNNNDYGFLEKLLHTNKTSLYKKHFKLGQKKLDKSFVYYTFKKNRNYFLNFNNKIYKIKSKKDFIDIFPSYKKEIQKFYNINRKLRIDNLNNFLIKLCKTINKEFIKE